MSESTPEMSSIRFLPLERIIQLHEESIARYGGDSGIRDRGLLESAIAQPQAGFAGQYLHEDIHAMAAAYLFHIVMNHPFVDGNKRTSALAAFVFLQLNGWRVIAEEVAFQDLTLAVARGELDKPAIADFFRAHTTR